MTDYDIVPFPKKDANGEYIASVSGDGFGIPVGAKNIEGGMAYAEFYFNYYRKMQDSPLNVDYFTDEQLERLENAKLSFTALFGYGLEDLFMQQFCNDLRKGGNLSTLLEQYRPKMQKAVEDVIKAK